MLKTQTPETINKNSNEIHALNITSHKGNMKFTFY